MYTWRIYISMKNSKNDKANDAYMSFWTNEKEVRVWFFKGNEGNSQGYEKSLARWLSWWEHCLYTQKFGAKSIARAHTVGVQTGGN